MTSKLNDIETRAKAYADARLKLAEYVDAMNEGIKALRKDNLPRIRRQVERAAQARAELQALVEQSPEHFTKPKTLVFHGIKVGFEKGKGAISFEDADQVVALIRKKLPDQADVLILSKYSPVKKALAQLTAQQLKAIGCTVEESGDRVIVRAVDTEVEKLVDALLKGAQVEEQEN